MIQIKAEILYDAKDPLTNIQVGGLATIRTKRARKPSEYITTPIVVVYDQNTGVFETDTAIYRPE